MLSRSLLVGLLLIICATTHAQTREWAVPLPPSAWRSEDRGDVDAASNFYLAFPFNGAITLSNGDVLVSEGREVLVAKYAPNKALVWYERIGRSAFIDITDLEVNDRGEVFLTGVFSGQASVGGTTLSAGAGGNSSARYLAKFGPQGQPVWARSYSARPDSVPNPSVRLQAGPAGDVYVSGIPDAQLPILGQTLPSNTYGYLMRLGASDGALQWIRFVRSADASALRFVINNIQSAAVGEQGNVYLQGEVRSSPVTIGGGTPLRLPSPYVRGLFVTAFSPSGDPLWTHTPLRVGNALAVVESQDFTTDQTGNYTLSASLQGQQVSIGPDSTTSLLSVEEVLANFNTAGNLRWATSRRGRAEQLLETDGRNVYAYNPSGGGLRRFDTDGMLQYSAPLPAGRKAVDPNGNIYIVGLASDGAEIFGTDTIFSGRYVGRVNCRPQPPEPFLGPTAVCGRNPLTYRTERDLSAFEYEWEATGPATVVATGNRAEVTWEAAGTYEVRLRLVNECGTGEPRALTVEVAEPPPAPTIAGDNTTCRGLTSYSVPDQAGITYSWELSGGGALVELGNTVLVDWLVPGTHVLSATAVDECGPGPAATFEVTVQESPAAPAVILGPTATCLVTQTYRFEGRQPGVNYRWTLSGGGTLNAADTSATVTWTTPGRYILSVVTEGLCGTSEARSLVIDVEPAPAQPSNVIGARATCVGVQSYSVVGVPGVNYNWQLDGGGTLTGSGASVLVDWLVPGIYTLTVTPSTACGTGPPRRAEVIVNPPPARPALVAGLTDVCLGQQPYAVPSVAGVSYLWSLSGGGVLQSEGNRAEVEWETAGTYTLTVTPFTVCGTGPPRTLQVSVKSATAPTDTVRGPRRVCLDTVVYSVPTSAGVTYTWSLSGGGLLQPAGNTATVVWQGVGLHTIVVASSDGCERAANVEVSDLPAVPDTIRGDTVACLGARSYAVTATNETEYDWTLSGGGTLIPAGNTATVDWTEAGQHTLVATPRNRCGDGPSDTLRVRVRTVPPTPGSIGGREIVCRGDTVRYGVPSLPEGSYAWSLTGGGQVLNLNTGDSLRVVWREAGTFELTATPSNPCGTGEAVTRTVVIGDVPAVPADVFGDSLVCLGDTVRYQAPPVANVSYRWAVTGGTLIQTVGTAVDVVWQTSGGASLSVTPENNCGSGRPFGYPVVVRTVPTSPGPIRGDTVACLGTSVYTVVARPGVSYVWSLSSGGTLAQNGEVATVTWREPGDHTVGVLPVNDCGPGTPAARSVRVGTVPPPPDAVVGATRVCLEDTLSYAVATPTDDAYEWNVVGGRLFGQTAGTVRVVWSVAGVGQLSVSQRNACGVGERSSLSVTVEDVPAAVSVSGPEVVCFGDTVLFTTPLTPNVSYVWGVEAGQIVSQANDRIQVVWDTPGDYNLVVRPTNECGEGGARTARVRVRSVPDVPVLQAFDTLACIGTSTYAVVSTPDTDYEWRLSGGGTLAANGGTAAVEWREPGQYVLSVGATDACGTGRVRTFTVRVERTLTAPRLSFRNDTLLADAPGTYQWFRDGELLPDATGPHFAPRLTGFYTARRVGRCGISGLSEPTRFAGEGRADLGVRLYPNPALSQVTLDVPVNLAWQRVYFVSVLGQQLGEVRVSDATRRRVEIDVRDLRAGTYVVVVDTDLGTVRLPLVILD
ncbi:MAG: hypothetical protein WBA12_13040 [Catalinimonas sp.]